MPESVAPSRAWIVLGLAASACTPFGPPPPTDAPPPPECQQIIDQCTEPAMAMGISAAGDCVRTARDMTTTAARCVEIRAVCNAACSPADASATD